MRFDRGTAHARGLGIGVGRAGGVEVPVKRIVERADDALDIRDRRDLLDLFRPDDLCIQPHEANFKSDECLALWPHEPHDASHSTLNAPVLEHQASD